MEKLDKYLFNQMNINGNGNSNDNSNSNYIYDVIVIFYKEIPKTLQDYSYLDWEEISDEYYLVKVNINDIKNLILKPEIKYITVGSKLSNI